ncbi:hypothetical protein ABZ816_01270 [Actinosynnema sp. NPDC047251]|uniref:Uncharacterized protein n=1 Tax=Saccharothrix espanaensis (strain ATCC 51144 / DSM 44229 / JCM 9112 / NBRC 15066 / NRRL 15764) TaxID=1179773 RepID=K0JXM2_SACES|nr:hypothetical protein [Saccharothrix espanaensis]CCH30881.1 hypothetical protein BN6_35850 [Saccharothrix espanaensis DSM 44229]
MVFPAPGAEVAHRRALRLDENARSITDRFGWSALVLGDDSAVGRKFPERYGDELTARSAGPVRIAFFAGRPAAESVAGPELARRLGLSDHLPCLVVVAEAGVHVLPFRERSAADVHRVLTGWMEEFHRANVGLVARWTAVEREIHRLVAELSGSLWAARERSARVRAERESLQRLESLGAAPLDLDAVLADRAGLPWALTTALYACRDRLRELDAVEAAGERMAAAARDLSGSDDRRALCRVLGRLTEDTALRRLLTPDGAAALTAARAAFGRDDDADVREWRADNGKLFTLPVFTAARQAWRWIADQGRLPRESPARHRERDFDAFTRALAAQPLGPAAADGVLAALAAHHGVTDEVEWTAATAGFRAYLLDAVDRLRATAPAGFTAVGHCLPTFAPPVRPLTDDLRDRRDALVRALRRDVPGAVADDRRTVLAAVPVLVEEHRARVAATLAGPAPEPTGEAQARRLAELVDLLGSYDAAVRSAVHPHLSESGVVAVEVATSPADALGVPPGEDPAEVLRRVAARTVAEHRGTHA